MTTTHTTEQKHAIKLLMAARKRAWKATTQRVFMPCDATTTTRAYVKTYLALNRLVDEGHSAATPATIPTQPTGPDAVEWEAANEPHALELLAA